MPDEPSQTISRETQEHNRIRIYQITKDDLYSAQHAPKPRDIREILSLPADALITAVVVDPNSEGWLAKVEHHSFDAISADEDIPVIGPDDR